VQAKCVWVLCLCACVLFVPVHMRAVSAGSIVDLVLLQSCLSSAEGDGTRVGKRDSNCAIETQEEEEEEERLYLQLERQERGREVEIL